MTPWPPSDHPGERIGQMYDRHAANLYRYALMILAEPAAAADAVQQVFVGLLRRRGGELDSDEAYLRRVVRNECFSALRRRQREPTHANSVPLESAAGHDCSPEERLAVEQALRSLPPEQREVVHLKIFEGMTFQEIADLADERLNTIASRYRYAIEKLRGMLSARL
jgi:RNA polymerase sigma-70 factor, ECF subfamily